MILIISGNFLNSNKNPKQVGLQFSHQASKEYIINRIVIISHINRLQRLLKIFLLYFLLWDDLFFLLPLLNLTFSQHEHLCLAFDQTGASTSTKTSTFLDQFEQKLPLHFFGEMLISNFWIVSIYFLFSNSFPQVSYLLCSSISDLLYSTFPLTILFDLTFSSSDCCLMSFSNSMVLFFLLQLVPSLD